MGNFWPHRNEGGVPVRVEGLLPRAVQKNPRNDARVAADFVSNTQGGLLEPGKCHSSIPSAFGSGTCED